MTTYPSNTAMFQLLYALEKRPGMTCAQIGQALWPSRKENSASMCRPAGKLVKRAIQQGLVCEKRNGQHRVFFLTH